MKNFTCLRCSRLKGMEDMGAQKGQSRLCKTCVSQGFSLKKQSLGQFTYKMVTVYTKPG